MVNFFYLDRDPKICAQNYCNKHIIKIPIEIAQILSKIHYELKSDIDYSTIYNNSRVVKNTLGPYLWALESYDNYIWTCQLSLELINEYKYRYNKSEHKTEKILLSLLGNPPELPKIGITKFQGTNKYDMFQYISNDSITCARYHYSEMKCENDKWTNRTIPVWFTQLKHIIIEKKKKLIDKINFQVRNKLPSLVTAGDKVFRFHSFLRIIYDHLFQGQWNVKAKMMNKFVSTKPLLNQLTYPQLYFAYEISKSLENKKTLSLLNTISLRYRKKLKFPNPKINYKKNPEFYVYMSDITGMLNVEQFHPYKIDLDESVEILYDNFIKYIQKNDFVGADIVRKYLQYKLTKFVKDSKNEDILFLSNKLKMINNNLKYLEWIDTFNWKKTDPYKPKRYIIN
jgi:hypothetical protein